MENPISAPFNLTIKEGQPVVSRDLEYKNGDTISFKITLPKDNSATIPDMHRKSVERVIELLQAWLKP